ncbi:AraC family transcriptional regulator [Bradyrhizobium sp.]|uniref:AraC family transcriptional regulator n=1 Tax=Bradyrhizobium sp. TaxID=376 RepID=UPI0039E5FC94
MPWLDTLDSFDPDALNQLVVGVAADVRCRDGGDHKHRMGQLLFIHHGYIRLYLDELRWMCMLPPGRAAWIPAGMIHRTRVARMVGYRSVWFDPGIDETLPDQPRVFAINGLLGAALERIAAAPLTTDWTSGKWTHLLALAASEIIEAPDEQMILPLPRDPRIGLSPDQFEDLPPTLEEFTARRGASVRTIGRIFQRETGMAYQQWRQRWRLIRAIEMLSSNYRTTDVATSLRFASDSAFCSFFKGMTGQTPRAFRAAGPPNHEARAQSG